MINSRVQELSQALPKFRDRSKLFRDPSFSRNHSIALIIHAGFQGRGISSNGRAPALHAGGTGIDTQVLHFFLLKLNVLAATFIRNKYFYKHF